MSSSKQAIISEKLDTFNWILHILRKFCVQKPSLSWFYNESNWNSIKTPLDRFVFFFSHFINSLSLNQFWCVYAQFYGKYVCSTEPIYNYSSLHYSAESAHHHQFTWLFLFILFLYLFHWNRQYWRMCIICLFEMHNNANG